MIYLLDRLVPIESLDLLLPFLPDFRKKKALSYRSLKDGFLSAATYLLLARALRDQGISNPGLFGYGHNGKPFLPDHPDIHFNLSHCGLGVCCITADCEVGIDIESVSRYNPAIAARVCCDDELRLIERDENPEKVFCRVWTKKESYLKMIGKGLGTDLRKLRPECDFFLYEENEFILCAAGQKSPELRIINSWEDLCR